MLRADDDEAISDAILSALVWYKQNPDTFGGGLIGMAGAVVRKLGIDGDLPCGAIRETEANDG